jgi:LuxR family glucitol operon transcriptional activator
MVQFLGSTTHYPQECATGFKKLTPKFEAVVQVRNRVAHSRPLQVDDFSRVHDLANTLAQKFPQYFIELKHTLQRIDTNPSFVLGLRIPSSFEADKTESHNLPAPDFDETGYIGRVDVIKQLIKSCLGPYPVITIVGEGGIGKTALALKVAYDILDLPDRPFDAVVWTSTKTRQLTASHIVEVDDAIHDSLGMIRSVSDQLSGQNEASPMDEVLSYLREFRILLILDNLETVIDQRIRDFMENLTSGSKVLITSRIGLGAFEFPVKLGPLDNQEAVLLLRILSQVRGVTELTQYTNRKLGVYCRKMHNNPGFIKWFVSAVQSGQRPEAILDKPDIFLEFCMSNVYHYLSGDSKNVLKSMQAVPGRHSQAELAFLSEALGVADLQRSLQELLTTNMVYMTSIATGSSFETKYEISELARTYIEMRYPLAEEEFKSLNKKRRQLVSAAESIAAEQKNPFSFNSIRRRSKSDVIVAKYLLDVLKLVKEKKLDEADEKIEEARRLAPEYFEVHRVEAIVRVSQGNYAAARTAYEAAIELELESAPLHYWYAGFLMRYLDDVEGALMELKKAEEINQAAYQIKLEMARAFLYLKKFLETREYLDDLLNRSDIDHWGVIKLLDLNLQYYQRYSEHCVTQHNEIAAIENLEKLKLTYLSYSEDIRDNIMLRKLEKAVSIATKCVHFTEGRQEQFDRAKEIHGWLVEQVRGEINSVGCT